jgi:methylated-DNA-[protein]-cysteine S-methyltransferase
MPWTLFDTALGTCGIAWSDAGVTGMQLPEENRDATRERLLAKSGATGAATRAGAMPDFVADAIERTRAHLGGKLQSFTEVPLDLGEIGPFNAKVYRALQAVPAGSTVSYGELAAAAGSASASRAVGRAMATNPVPIFVPCHRVLAAEGKPGGFSAYGGVLTKERILEIEGWRRPAAPLFAALPRSGSLGFPQETLPYDRQAALAHLTGADPVLAAHLAKIGDFTLALKQTEGVFSALAEAIVYQQLSGKAAATIYGRVRALLPKGQVDARALTLTSDDDLRRAGLSRSKLAALRDLSERTLAGNVPTLAQLRRLDDEAIVEKLTEVRGIGRWTVEMLLIFRLGRPDVLPVADYGIKKGYARVFHRGKKKDELPTADDLTRRGERWRPFRSVASWYLWRALDEA